MVQQKGEESDKSGGADAGGPMFGTQHLRRALRSIHAHEKLISLPKAHVTAQQRGSRSPVVMVTVRFEPALIQVASLQTHEALEAEHRDNTSLPVTVRAAVCHFEYEACDWLFESSCLKLT